MRERRLPLPPCRHPGCGELQTEARRGFCTKHQAIDDERFKRGRYRTSARKRGYTSAYERARAWLLAHEPLCRRCQDEGRTTPAVQTHHIVPLSEGGSNSVRNLEPICEPCHRALHAAER